MLGQTDGSTDTVLGGVAQWLAAFGMNEVNARRARLVLGWVTVFGRYTFVTYLLLTYQFSPVGLFSPMLFR